MASRRDRSLPSDGLPSTAYRPGHVFWLPAGSTWLNRDKPRPFALATPCRHRELGTLIYGSTQETEKSAGAACVAVAPSRTGLNRNGLRTRTHFYPGVLLPAEPEYLPPHSGFLGKSLDELRTALRIALGIGCGSCLRSTAPAGSRRGRVVRLAKDLADDIQADFAIILTEPEYSAAGNYQIILPIFTSYGRAVSTYDLLVSSGNWLNVFPRPMNHVVLPVPTTHSVWHGNDIGRETEYVVDDQTLGEIDRRLCGYFSLPPVEGEG